MKKIILSLAFALFAIATYAQTEYKIGVQFFRTEKATATQASLEKNLDDMVAALTANQPNRTVNGKKVKLVVGVDVSWALTETAPGIYDFEWFKNFATLCEERRISWTPLLSPHYVPGFIYNNPNSKYANHKINYVDGSPRNQFNFLPYSPSSPIWDNEVANWIKAFINAMVDSNHITTSPWNRKAIDEILVGNEMIYPFNEATSGDAATKAQWIQDGHSIDDYPTTTDEFIHNWNSFLSYKPNPLRDFRNKELAYCIAGMMHVTKYQLAKKLGRFSAKNIGVSSKLIPYLFPRVASVGHPGTSISDEFCGYDEAQIGYLIEQSNKFVAVDIYASPNSAQDYKATSRRLAASGKSMYLAEYNRAPNADGSHTPLTATEIYNFGKTGFDHLNLKYYIYFAWNPDPPQGEPNIFKINESQQLGLYNLFNKLAPVTNPIEPGTQNNFASGAYTIPANYNNNKSHSMTFGDADWYKFTFNGKAHYLKVTQKNKVSKPVEKKYGIKLITNFLEITAETYSTYDGELDTEIRLYNQDLVELASNDNANGYTTFSKLKYSRFNFPPIFIPKETGQVIKKATVSEQNSANELEEFNVSIFPNPVKDYLNLSIKGLDTYYSISIKDANNNTVFEDKRNINTSNRIDISQIKSGLYFVTIQTGTNQKIIKKLIKK